MSLRLNLARNLQSLSRRIGSANLVSRELGINRQQFEKYLKGRSLPSATTLSKICSYFGITEEQLFAEDPGAASAASDASTQRSSCEAVLKPLLGEPFAPIRSGIYFLWMTVPMEADNLVCAPVFVSRGEQGMMFRRITGGAEPREKLWWHRVGDHKGIVVERLSWLIFVAVNQRGNQDPTMIRLKWVPLSTAVLGGHATILTPAGISFSAACMRPAPAGTTYRQALRQSRKFSGDDPAIDPITKMVIDQERRELLRIIQRDVSL